MSTGVLALQGAFGLHRSVFAELGETTIEVRTLSELLGIERLVIPGGESSVMSMLATANGLVPALRDLIAGGVPILGTCAGAIMLATEIIDAHPAQVCLAGIDMTVRRNAFGRQVDSFVAQIDMARSTDGGAARSTDGGAAGGGAADGESEDNEAFVVPTTFEAVFIRAPAIERTGPSVEVLASHRGQPVMVRCGSVLATTFHPELSGHSTVHQLFLEM